MSKYKMTDRWVNSFRPSAGARAEVGDLLCPGLYLRASTAGAKSWSAVVRVGARVQRVTLGRYPVVTLAEAREQTLALLRSVADGSLVAAQAVRDSGPCAEPVNTLTFGEVIDAYVKHISTNARSWRLIAANLRRVEMRPLHGRVAAEIGKGELVAVVDALAGAGTPHAATSLLKHLKMAINFAVERDMLPANPLDKVRPPQRTTERDRVLTDSELGAVWRACGKLPQPWCAMIRMLMLSGCRRNEIARMSHAEIQDDVLIIPAPRVKMGRPHAVPLVPIALATLAPLRQPGATGFVFSTDGGATAASNFAKVKRALDERCDAEGCSVKDWVLHDLRRSLRSGLAALGVSRDVARAVLNHADGKVDAIYNRYQYAVEKREALEKWARHLGGLAET